MTLQQQTKDTEATLRHLADAYEASNCDNAEQLRKRANMMRGWVGALNSWRDDMREAVCAAVDEDAPKFFGHVHPLDMGEIPAGAFVSMGSSKFGRERCEDAPRRCAHFAVGYCYHPQGSNDCIGRDNCDWYEPRN